MKKIFDNPNEYNAFVDRIKSDKDWFNIFIEMVKRYYRGPNNSCGGSLHIVLDDGNLEKRSLNWCSGYSCGVKDDAGYEIAELMLFMTMRQRKKVYSNYDMYRF